MTHETLDQIKLAQHKLIAKKLQENPEAILALARRNLQRYIGNRPAPATSLWREWQTLLEENSGDRIVAVMTAKTRESDRVAASFAFCRRPQRRGNRQNHSTEYITNATPDCASPP